MHGPRPSSARQLWRCLVLVLAVLGFAASASAQDAVPELHAAADLSALYGRPITKIEVLLLGTRWREQQPSARAEVGQVLSAELVRRSLDELLESGGFADAPRSNRTATASCCGSG